MTEGWKPDTILQFMYEGPGCPFAVRVNFLKREKKHMEKKPARAIALLPIGVFLVLYLGLGLVFEYGLHIKMGFYNIPIVVPFVRREAGGHGQGRRR